MTGTRSSRPERPTGPETLERILEPPQFSRPGRGSREWVTARKTVKVAQAEMTIEQARQVFPIGPVPRMVCAMPRTDPLGSRHLGNRTHEIPHPFDVPSALQPSCAGRRIPSLRDDVMRAHLPGVCGCAGGRSTARSTSAAVRRSGGSARRRRQLHGVRDRGLPELPRRAPWSSRRLSRRSMCALLPGSTAPVRLLRHPVAAVARPADRAGLRGAGCSSGSPAAIRGAGSDRGIDDPAGRRSRRWRRH